MTGTLRSKCRERCRQAGRDAGRQGGMQAGRDAGRQAGREAGQGDDEHAPNLPHAALAHCFESDPGQTSSRKPE